jgi:hypothetical protein
MPLVFHLSPTLYTGTDPGFVGPQVTEILGPYLRKRLQNYEYKIVYESEYLFEMNTEITTNYKFKKAHKYHRRHKIRINCQLIE